MSFDKELEQILLSYGRINEGELGEDAFSGHFGLPIAKLAIRRALAKAVGEERKIPDVLPQPIGGGYDFGLVREIEGGNAQIRRIREGLGIKDNN